MEMEGAASPFTIMSQFSDDIPCQDNMCVSDMDSPHSKSCDTCINFWAPSLLLESKWTCSINLSNHITGRSWTSQNMLSGPDVDGHMLESTAYFESLCDDDPLGLYNSYMCNNAKNLALRESCQISEYEEVQMAALDFSWKVFILLFG